MARFTHVCRLENRHGDGHRIFTDTKHEGEYAIADNSGLTPDRTDDGVLYVDVYKIQKHGLSCGPERDEFVGLPLFTEQGNPSRTMVSVAGAMQLLRLLKLPEEVKMEREVKTPGVDHVRTFKIVPA
jgi:hypothetical protein